MYGAGLLLFVSLYCVSGVEPISTCWWILGMTPLIMDELMGDTASRVFTGVVMFMLYLDTGLLWVVEGGAEDDMFGYDPWRLLTGIVVPVLCPLFFFSFRSTARTTNVRDVLRLCGLALPFMVVLALCVLVWTEAPASGRRGLNATMVETHARFHATETHADAPSYFYLETVCMLFSPFAAAAVLYQLVAAVTEGFTSEFVSALILLVSVRHGVIHQGSEWFASFLGISVAAVAFLLLLCWRRG